MLTGGSEKYGIDSVRAWDSSAASAIVTMAFFASIVLASSCICISVGKYDVNPQVATQTTFTIPALILVADQTILRELEIGRKADSASEVLLITLFAFFDI